MMKHFTKAGVFYSVFPGGIFSRWAIPPAAAILLFLLLSCAKSMAQSGNCDPQTPFFAVNLVGNPGGTWVSSPPVSRAGNCCGTLPPDKCIEFEVTLDPTAVSINFQIASGAIPPGALFYQVNCGPPVPVGSPICISGPGPHMVTFCKPGNNQNTYAITSTPGPAVSPADTTGDGCSTTAWIGGVIDTTITWSEITSGTNAYLSYLNCTTDCDTVTITPAVGHPPYVDYVVCGKPLSMCYPTPFFCDTIRVHFLDPIQNTITPNPPYFCANQNGVMLSGNILGGLAPYTVNWTNGLNGTGTVIGTNPSYFATAAGNYSMIVYDATYPKCPPQTTNVTVTIHPVPIVNAGPDKIICATNPSAQLAGAITNATGGIWTTSGTGTFSPSNTALNAMYTASAADIANGSVTLTLTSTGNGPCLAVTDQVQIIIDPAINVTVPFPIVCYNQTGTLTANVTGGTAPYFYSWNTGATTSTINNVVPGTYTVTVSDGLPGGCITTHIVNVTQNPPINITTPFNSLVSCDTLVNITVSANGGTSPLTYLWNTGSTNTSITVPTGQYIVTVTDANGCKAKDTVAINAANSPLAAFVNQPPNLCYGATTTLSASATGGFGSFTYNWNTGASGSTINVGAGTYCATVTDGQGCMNQYCVTVTQSPPLTISASNPGTICFGATATVNASASGGQGPYTFFWNTGNGGPSLTATAGNYTVTVTDSNSPACSASAAVVISQATPLVVSGSSQSVSCNGGNNGSATANVSGSIGPYAYSWPFNSGTSSTIYGLSAGTYAVNVTDAIGCVQSINVTVTEPPVLNASISGTSNVSCNGGSNGTATVFASGGTPSYTYFWSPAGGPGSTGSGLYAGTFTVTVTDTKGCYTTATATITQPLPLTGSVTGNSPVSCYGGSNGSASVAASGGNGNYNYYWQETGGNSAYENGLGAGTYNVTIADWAGCTVITQVVITSPPPLVVTVSNVSGTSCYGGSNGSALLNASGGTPNYTYYWPSQNFSGAAISNLPAGTYTYEVTDANNCLVTNSITITQPTALVISTASASNATCYGVCNGTAAVSASGATPPYTFQWSSGQTTSSVSGLCAGTYTATITDSRGCTNDTVLTVNQPTALNLVTSAVAANCMHADGSAGVSVTGGTPAYYYSWNTSPTQFSSTANNLVPGNYIVTVTDNNNCIKTATVTVNNQPGVSISSQSFSNTTCSNNCNGNATISGTGGTGPYTYFWNTSPSQNTATASGLCPGNYSVIISDANNCKDTAIFTITAPAQVTASVTATSTSICAGDATTLSATASGGTGIFSYNWNNGTYFGQYYTVSPTVNTTYTVVASDANGCQSAAQVLSISVHPVPTANAGPDKTVCSSSPVVQLSGSVTNATGAVWSGGTGSFTPSPTSLNISYTPSASEIAAGQVTLTLTSTGNGACQPVSDYVTITIAQQFSVTISNGTVCYGQTGSLSASVSGGVAPYTFSWSTGATTPTLSNIPPGNYMVTVTDAVANGCSASQSGNLNQNPQMFVSLPGYVTSCNTTATVTATGSGGTGALTFLWSTGASTSSISAPSGSYTVTVYDALGCSVQDNITVNAVIAPIAAFTSQPSNLCYGATTTVSANATGGYGSYSYSWSSGAVTPSITAGAGNYFVTITDSAGCSDTSNVTVTQSAQLTVSVSNPPVICYGSSATVSANASGGQGPYAYSWNTGQTTASITQPAGTYTVTVTDANTPSCIATGTVTITQSTPLVVTGSSTPVGCFGGSNGTATASPSGSVGPYSFSWASISSTSGTISGLVVGNYQATVTDAIGCVQNVTIAVTQPPGLNLTTSSISSHCSHPDGSATVNASGGTPAYYYSWNTSPAQFAPTANNLVPGNYIVTVTDNNNCVQTATVTVNNLPGVSIASQSFMNTTCSYNCNGSATITGTGGNGPYAYFWNTSPAQTTATATGLCPGNYTVIISDYNNCRDTASFTITAPPAVTVSASATSSSICAGDATTLSANGSGGSGIFSYNWNNGTYFGQYYTVTPAVNTTYTVIASDANGCQSSPSLISVSVHPVPAVNAGTDVTVCASTPVVQLSGSITNATGGTWSGGSGSFIPSNTSLNASYNPSASEISAGQVTLTLTSTGNGACAPVSDYMTITIAQQFSVTISNGTVCYGQTGSLTASVSGGVAPYSFSWSTGATTPSISNIPPGTYNVMVTDAVANGCSAAQSGNLSQNPQMFVNLPGYTTSCNTTATITASGSGGTGALSYLWSTGATSSSISVSSGTYSVTVYDALGCSIQDTISVNAVIAPIAAFTSQPSNLCYGASTTITSNASGGYGSYSYSWSTGAITSSITAGAGNYYVTITDSAGCSDTANVTVTQSALLTVSISNPPVICNGGSATISASVAGGQNPYSYLWSTGQSNASITQPAGNYTVTVTDGNSPSCTATASVTITQATPLTVNGSSSPVSCFGGNDGTATANPSGSASPYSYSWASSAATSSTLTGLVSGNYQATVTDAIGCVQTITITVTQPTAISSTISSLTNVSCNGGNNGSATVSPSGGSPGYTYSWIPSGGNTATGTAMIAGNYTVTITDQNGCSHNNYVFISQPSQLAITTASTTPVSCNGGNNGSASVTGNGGSGTYSYYWSPGGGTASIITNLAAGNYFVTLTDSAGCTDTASVFVSEPPPLADSVTNLTHVSCNSTSNGTATLAALGGTPAYAFYWPSLGVAGPSVSGLSAGTYTYSITDANGCSVTSSITIVQPADIVFSFAGGFDATCYGTCDGMGVILPTGGQQPFTYQWSSGQNTQNINNSCAGNYTVTVTDMNGCSEDTVIVIGQPAPVGISTSSLPANCFHADGSATAAASGGTPGYSYSWNTSPVQNGATASGLVPGSYIVTATDANGCTGTDTIAVMNQPGVTASIQSITNTSCSNVCNGSVTAAVSGGVGPYTYSWNTNPAQTTATASTLCPGSYMVTITDNNNCVSTATATVSAPPPLTLAPLPTSTVICNGQSAILTASATGGSGNISFSWNNGQYYGSTYIVSPSTTTLYTVVAIDSNFCTSAPQTIAVTINPALTAIVAPGLNVCQGATLYLTASASGGNGNYTYTWGPGNMNGASVSAVPPSSMTYSVVISDGCSSDTGYIPVTVYPLPAVNFSADINNGCAPVCINFVNNSTSSNGSIIVGWNWNFGDNDSSNLMNPTHCFLTSGSFDVSLTALTNMGCSTSFTFTDFVQVQPSPEAEFSFTPEFASATDPVISFFENASGETSWLWNFGDGSDTSMQPNPEHHFKQEGEHCVTLTVVNSYNCRDTAIHCLKVNPEFSFYIPNCFTPNANGKNDSFTGKGENIKEYTMWIYDRWGDMIFETHDLNVPWDGRANNGKEIAQTDVYVYVVHLVDIFNEPHDYIGHVTLLK